MIYRHRLNITAFPPSFETTIYHLINSFILGRLTVDNSCNRDEINEALKKISIEEDDNGLSDVQQPRIYESFD